jgi:uncharacterized membrane protein (UPF0127 family)
MTMRQKAAMFALAAIAGFVIFAAVHTAGDVPVPSGLRFESTVLFPDSAFTVAVSRTPAELRKGLSGSDPLLSGQGMLFVFPEDGRYGIWMKDMNYPIDVLWLSGDRTVVHIREGFLPASYPEVEHPASSVRYVLELPAGSVRASGIKIGSQARFMFSDTQKTPR